MKMKINAKNSFEATNEKKINHHMNGMCSQTRHEQYG